VPPAAGAAPVAAEGAKGGWVGELSAATLPPSALLAPVEATSLASGATLPFVTSGAFAGVVVELPLVWSLFVVLLSPLGFDCPIAGTVAVRANSIIKNKVLHKRIMDPLQPRDSRPIPQGTTRSLKRNSQQQTRTHREPQGFLPEVF
jgi:hypothetical protein